MSESRSLTDLALVIRSYAELDKFVAAFARGHLSLIIICGDAGLGKSRCVRAALRSGVCWIDGMHSPFGIYIQAYQHRNVPLVLDDIDGLYRDRNGVRLLKGLCQSEKVKSLSWQTQAPALDRLRIPRQFTTKSRVVIIANQWKSLNADVAALEDRGHFLLFKPSVFEIHRHAASWFWDQEVFDFVGNHLHMMDRHSLRTYVRAWEMKSASLDWRQGVLSRCATGTALEVARLSADPCYQTEKDRAQAFVAAGFGCRATYFNCAKKFRTNESGPEIRLVCSAPPMDIEQSQDISNPPHRRVRKSGKR